MSYMQYWAIFNRWYIAYTLLYIRHSPCTCRIHGILIIFNVHFYTSDTPCTCRIPGHTPCTCRKRGIGPYSTIDTYLYTFIHQTSTLYMSYTQYWAIFNRWYIAYTLLYIRHSPCTCRIYGIGPYSTGDTCALLYIRHTPCTCRIRGIGPYTNGDTWTVHIYTSDIHPVHVVYAVLVHIQPLIHSLYTFIHQTFTLHMSYRRYWAIFNRWYIPCTLLYIRDTPCTCRIHGIGPYSTGDTYPVHFYTSDIHPVHVVYAVLGHIQPVIHSLYTFIHQTFTLYMSYTWYFAIFNRWYIACTLLNIRHTPCTCRIRGIGQYSTGDTWLVHFYTSDIHPVYVVYAVLGHIPTVINVLYIFIHQTYTLYMLYTRYWSIFNRWYMSCTLLYIRHTPCTCRKRGIGPYSTIDT